jgi:hypothetical protein
MVVSYSFCCVWVVRFSMSQHVACTDDQNHSKVIYHHYSHGRYCHAWSLSLNATNKQTNELNLLQSKQQTNDSFFLFAASICCSLLNLSDIKQPHDAHTLHSRHSFARKILRQYVHSLPPSWQSKLVSDSSFTFTLGRLHSLLRHVS